MTGPNNEEHTDQADLKRVETTTVEESAPVKETVTETTETVVEPASSDD